VGLVLGTFAALGTVSQVAASIAEHRGAHARGGSAWVLVFFARLVLGVVGIGDLPHLSWWFVIYLVMAITLGDGLFAPWTTRLGVRSL